MSDLLYSAYRRWGKCCHNGQAGIIVGADLTQEWILPWWWKRYQRFNSHPVAFFDLGMSLEMKAWCKERGIYIHLPVADIFVADKEQVEEQKIDEWEQGHGKQFWPSRNAWFKKPLACLQTPFQRTIWIDLDCEIRGSLDRLFEFCEHPSRIAMAREIQEQAERAPLYNSGVIVFQRGIPLFEEWADDAIDRNHLFSGDQNALSQRIFDEHIKIGELPLIYNWSRCNPDNPDAVILHWHGVHGKKIISHQIWEEQLQ